MAPSSRLASTCVQQATKPRRLTRAQVACATTTPSRGDISLPLIRNSPPSQTRIANPIAAGSRGGRSSSRRHQSTLQLARKQRQIAMREVGGPRRASPPIPKLHGSIAAGRDTKRHAALLLLALLAACTLPSHALAAGASCHASQKCSQILAGRVPHCAATCMPCNTSSLSQPFWPWHSQHACRAACCRHV